MLAVEGKERLHERPLFHRSPIVMICRPRLPVALALGLSLLAGCGDDGGGPTEDNQTADLVTPPSPTPSVKPPAPEALKPPVVYKEETDQSQEYFKEQHDTSFSHVHKKNWFSFTAGKSGVLTRISFYCKPHFPTSSLYGKVMQGVIREGNPELGRKLGEWSLSRDEVVAQLAAQGLTEVDYGWVDVKMLGEVSQKPGTVYYFVCTSISEGKHWFGAIAFAENDTYPGGRHWLHPEHDLVFRTYVGQVEAPLPPPAPPEANATEEPAPEANVTPPSETPPAETNATEPTPPAAPEANATPPAPAPEANVTIPPAAEANVTAPNPAGNATAPPPVPTPPAGPPQPRIRNVVPPQVLPQAPTGEVPPEFDTPFTPPTPPSPEPNATSPIPGGTLLPGLFPSAGQGEAKP